MFGYYQTEIVQKDVGKSIRILILAYFQVLYYSLRAMFNFT